MKESGVLKGVVFKKGEDFEKKKKKKKKAPFFFLGEKQMVGGGGGEEGRGCFTKLGKKKGLKIFFEKTEGFKKKRFSKGLSRKKVFC